MTDENKKEIIDRINMGLHKIRSDIKEVSGDMDSTDLGIQASAVWIGNNLCSWYQEFVRQMQSLDKEVHGIKQEMQNENLIPKEEGGIIQ